MRKLNIDRLTRNPFLVFSPFLIFYVVFVIILREHATGGDALRYVHSAEDLIRGYYSPPAPNINLPNGPGYPIFLIPFMAINLPFICITLMNAVFHYLSIVFLFKALRYIVTVKIAFLFSLFWACYYVAYQNMAAVTTETITMCLISLLILCLIKAFTSGNNLKYVVFSGLILGYIVLIKVIFGYVLLLMLVGCIVLYLVKKTISNYRRALLVVLIAFATTTPYLVYTYHLTGKIFYWGTGSDNLYWMSTPYEDEYGDWKGVLERGSIAMGNYNIPGAEDTLIVRHQKDYEEAYSVTGTERDDVFKRIAINNIKTHPVKYVKNIFYNIGRMLFHYPYSYAIERRISLFAMPINGVILTFILLSLIPTIINWRKIIFPIRFLLILVLFYMGGSSLLSSDLRMFALIVPIMLFWIAYIMSKTVRFTLKIDNNDNQQ